MDFLIQLSDQLLTLTGVNELKFFVSVGDYLLPFSVI